MESPFWRNTKFLKKTFKATTVRDRRIYKKQVGLVFPVCLLFGALTLTDRLIVVNWWVNQPKERMSFHTERFKKFFRTPSKNAELLPLMTSAAGAAEALCRNITPNAACPFDSHALRTTFAASTRSSQIVENTKKSKRRSVSEPAARSSQMDDRCTRRSIEALGKRALSLLKCTENIHGLDETVEIAVLVKQKVRMRTSKRGRPCLTAPMVTKRSVFSRNESAFKALIDDFANLGNDNTNNTMSYTFGDHSDEMDELQPHSEPLSEIAVARTNTNDEEDVITSLLRLNQENIAPDSDDEPEWMQHLAD
jgi:hypothetical protein